MEVMCSLLLVHVSILGMALLNVSSLPSTQSKGVVNAWCVLLYRHVVAMMRHVDM